MTLLDLPQVPLTLSQFRSDHGDVLSMSGYMDAFTAPTLKPAFMAAVEALNQSKAGSLIVDLSCVRFMDRSGLDMLLRVREKIAGQDCTLIIRLRPGSQPETLFRANKLENLMTATYESEL